MEELRSTEILAREIEAEALKKAGKIIEKAERQSQKILSEVEIKIHSQLEEKKKEYEKKLLTAQNNAQSYIPLDKERFCASYCYEQLCSAFNDYFNSIGLEKRIEVYKNKFEIYKIALEEKKLNVSFYGELSENDVKKIIGEPYTKNSLNFYKTEFAKTAEDSEPLNSVHEGIIIETQDNSTRIRLTMDEIIGELKDKYSYELSCSLFGGKLPQ